MIINYLSILYYLWMMFFVILGHMKLKSIIYWVQTRSTIPVTTNDVEQGKITYLITYFKAALSNAPRLIISYLWTHEDSMVWAHENIKWTWLKSWVHHW